ncbi:MAG: restriction endonuclease subunit S [Deltaproteobacteria bacterium]|nr:restriction endonuclease subunit S [Deltaproteobacteria bacterium]MBI3391268.1 restriction endonuclease subunit S [Deltaproteobacteria bacterium]
MSAVESNDAWLGKMPSDWQRSRLRNVAALSPGYSATVPASDEACTVAPMELLSDDGAIDVTNQQPLDEVTSGLTLFEAGDVLFAKITPCMENGKGAFVRKLPTRYAFGSTEFHVLRPSKKIDGTFLYYVTFNPIYRAYAAENMVGAAGQKRVSSRFVKDTRLFLPPLPEQQRIAAYLDASCAAIDAAVAAKRRQHETLDALRKSIIQRAVTRGTSARVALESTGNAWMEEIPRGWKLVCLKRIAAIQGGLTLGKQYEGSLIERPYLRVGNVQDGHLDLADVSVIELPASVAAGVELRPDDVLMTEGGDLDKLGRGHLWRGEITGCLHQNHIFAVRCFLHKLKPMFLAYVTAAQYGRDYFEATGKKTTNLACTNATKVGEFPIPLPSLTEQEAICVYLDEKLGELKRIVSGIESQIATLTAYRKSLIHECVTGQRQVTDDDVRRAGHSERSQPTERRA